jgi:predicted O-methyltransferase YrrM
MFQKMMDTILQGIPGTICYVDDILVTGATEEEHLRNLEEVFHLLQDHNIRVKKEKCRFLQNSVDYLGHRVDAEGLRPLPDKLEAIVKAPLPQDVHQLRSFLGLLSYYRKFLSNLAAVVQSLNDLLQKGKKWCWSAKCSEAVRRARELLTRSDVLVHYDRTLPLKLAADASPYGLGAVISIGVGVGGSGGTMAPHFLHKM